MSQKAEKQHGTITDAPWWMWATAFLGFVLVFGSIAFMLYEAAAGDSSPPDVAVHVESILPMRNGFLVRFRVINEGGSTAEGVAIEGELRNGVEHLETSDTTIEYVPSHSEREGGLFFSADPRQYDLRIRAKGYEKP